MTTATRGARGTAGPADMTLFKIDTKTGQVTGFSVRNGQNIRRSHSITKDRNGIIWFDGGDGPLGPARSRARKRSRCSRRR